MSVVTYTNLKALSPNHQIQLQNRVEEVVRGKYPLPFDFRVHISSHLKINGRCFVEWKKGVKVYYFSVSNDLYKVFGFERFMQTVMHELAHLIDYAFNGKLSHSEFFKSICSELGGSMNSTMAGESWANCSSTDFVGKREQKRWRYECQCGNHIFRNTRYSKPHEWCCKKCRKPATTFTLYRNF